MEKLMELLRKYEIERRKNSCLIKKIPYGNNNDIKKNRFLIISKEYGFIKWLVDNDKIDRDKLEKKVLKEDLIRKFDEGLIMLLSISDHPIEDLCKLLK